MTVVKLTKGRQEMTSDNCKNKEQPDITGACDEEK